MSLTSSSFSFLVGKGSLKCSSILTFITSILKATYFLLWSLRNFNIFSTKILHFFPKSFASPYSRSSPKMAELVPVSRKARVSSNLIATNPSQYSLSKYADELLLKFGDGGNTTYLPFSVMQFTHCTYIFEEHNLGQFSTPATYSHCMYIYLNHLSLGHLPHSYISLFVLLSPPFLSPNIP